MRIRVLGPLAVDHDGEPVPVGGPRVRALLATLALDPGHPVPAARLVATLWGDRPPANPVNALQTLVKRLRAALRPVDAIVGRSGGYLLDLPPEAVDAHRFAALADRARDHADPARRAAVLDEALALWRGPALADLRGLPHLDALDALAAPLEERRLAAVEAHAEACLAAGREIDLTAEVAAAPLRERLCALAVRALAAAGRQADALALFEATRRRLADELGVDPGEELAAAHLAVLRGHARRPAPAPRHPGSPRHPGRIRPSLTSFVGREDELRLLAELVAGSRLVTIVGPGGGGKTRLAIELAAAHQDEWPDGVRLAELAPIRDPVDVPHAVLDALGGTDGDGTGRGGAGRGGADPRRRVTAALTGRTLLLVLDNCEHVVDAAAELADLLLRECPDIVIVATSREPLGVPGEALLLITPLGLPPAGHLDPREAARYPAVRLFADRAANVRPGFTLDTGNAPAVTAICRSLDGLPLAIELAAARIRALTPAQIAERLDDRFRLLTAGSRVALPRHQTLRAVVAWSWDLLTEAERRLARRLSVFAGGATLDSVEQVCAADAADLAALVDKSLVEVDDAGRYRMLETIRAYAAERLAESGEATRLWRRHAEHLIALAENAEPRLRTADQMTWIRRLAAEHDNLNAVLRWAIDSGETVTAVRLCGSLNWYWWFGGYRTEAAVWAGQVLALVGETPPPGLVRAYAGCVFAWGMSRIGRVLREPRSLQEICRRMDDLIGLAEAEGPVHPLLRIGRALLAAMSGRTERAGELLARYAGDSDPWLASSARMIRSGAGTAVAEVELDLEQAVAGFRDIGERWGLSEALITLATLRAARGDASSTTELLTEVDRLTDDWLVPEETISTLSRMAGVRAANGDLAGAAAALAKARGGVVDGIAEHCLLEFRLAEAELARRTGDLTTALAAYQAITATLDETSAGPQLTAWARAGYGRALAQAGDTRRALAEHRAALNALDSMPELSILVTVIGGLAVTALAGGDTLRAATLLGIGMAIAGGAPSDPEVIAVMERLRTVLGEPAFRDALDRGRALGRAGLPGLVAAMGPD